MNLVKVRSSKDSRINKSIKIFPDGKEITLVFNEDAIAEVNEDILIDVLEIDQSLSLVDKNIQEKIDKIKKSDNAGFEEKIKVLEGKISILVEQNTKLVKENQELREALSNSKGDVIDIGNEGEDGGQNKDTMTKKDLERMKKDDLVEIAKEASFSEEEWVNLNKKSLVDYLFEKLNA